MNYLQNPQHWRNRAEETRAKAEALNSAESKQLLLLIAEEYDGLADDYAAARLRSDKLLEREVNPQRQPERKLTFIIVTY